MERASAADIGRTSVLGSKQLRGRPMLAEEWLTIDLWPLRRGSRGDPVPCAGGENRYIRAVRYGCLITVGLISERLSRVGPGRDPLFFITRCGNTWTTRSISARSG